MAVFLPALKRQGYLDRVHITVCSVGSRKWSAQDDLGDQGWNIFAPHLSIYGFDADADACDAANADLAQRQINWTEHHFPVAIGNNSEDATLYVTKYPMCSSLYPPNEALLERFQYLPEFASLDFTVQLETTTLEAFCRQVGIETIDFLQIDVQGAELQVLQGATQFLQQTVLGIQLEVEFAPIYVGQPLFADLDLYLRAQDFTLFDLDTVHRVRARSPIASQRHPGQLLWGEAFYFCDLLQTDIKTHPKTPEQLFKLACIADVLEFADYALELLEYLTLTYGTDPAYNFADVIVTCLSEAAEQPPQALATLPIMSRLQAYLS
jgi:FkbM family methyltransferase